MNARTQTKPDAIEELVGPAPNNLPAVAQPNGQSSARAITAAATAPAAKQFPPAIARSILAVTREIGRIQKDGNNTFQRYRYASWEAINDKLSPLLAQHNLLIMQSEITRSLLEENAQGSILAIVYEFTIVDAETGEFWPPIPWTATCRLRDSKGVSDDKAAPKCATQAEKYFCIKQFKIRTNDKIDSDADGHHTNLPKKDARGVYAKLQEEINTHPGPVATFDQWCDDSNDRVETLPQDWIEIIVQLAKDKRAALVSAANSGKPATVVTNMLADQPETGEVIWDEAQQPSNDRAWTELGPVKHAGILCNDSTFQRFIAEIHNIPSHHAVSFVRNRCLVTSRADIRDNHPSGRAWRELVAEYRAWQHGFDAQRGKPDEPAAPADHASSQSAPGAAGHDDVLAWDARLITASHQGVKALEAEWALLPDDPAIWKPLQKAMERHLGVARGVDAAAKAGKP
jgi:hypothetical protein